MKLCRFHTGDNTPRIGVWEPDNTIVDLSTTGITSLTQILEADNPAEAVPTTSDSGLQRFALDAVTLLGPVEQQEVWAAGVTYQRSKTARMEESEFSASAYDLVYDADRPEIFFKSMPEKVVPSGKAVGIRKDASWNVPEPELTLVVNSKGVLAGFTIGNDMSSRDIEGENLLYLPQAKTYYKSCAVGPAIVIGATEADARQWSIHLQISRSGNTVFEGTTSVDQIKRSFPELVDYLCRSQSFPHGALLLTGTGIVPPDDFTLWPDDRICIEISGIGVLENTVQVV